MKKVNSSTPEETFQWGCEFGKHLKVHSVIAMHGDLGAGKTTLIKGIAHGAGDISPRDVSSPTYTYLNIYTGKQKIFHFDLYRLKTADDFLSLGFDEYFEEGGICLIEWPEKIRDLLPSNSLTIEIEYTSEKGRALILGNNFNSFLQGKA